MIPSKSLKTTVELTLLAKVRPGYPKDVAEPVSYLARLRALLDTYQELRKQGTERRNDAFISALDTLQTLRAVRWCILGDESDAKLLLCITFDKPWEPYIRQIVDDAGPLLDSIFCHCEDYSSYSTGQGYPAFRNWVRSRQVNASFFFASQPELTIEDMRYLQRFEDAHRTSLAQRTASADDDSVVQAPGKTSRKKQPDNNKQPDDACCEFDAIATNLIVLEPRRQALLDLEKRPEHERKKYEADLADSYFKGVGKLYALDALFRGGAEAGFYYHVSHLLLDPLDPFERKSKNEALKKLGPLLAQWRETYRKLGKPLSKLPCRIEHPDDDADIQGGIVKGYQGMNVGAFVFVRFNQAQSPGEVLRKLLPRITNHQQANALAAGGTAVNVALTLHGLKALGIGERVLADLPQEFREGLEARAGLLGDVGDGHPSKWKRPGRNWPPTPGQPQEESQEIDLSTVDLVLLVRKSVQPDKLDQPNKRKQYWQWSDKHPLKNVIKELVPDADILHVQPLFRQEQKGKVKEHFGFADGISNPEPYSEHSNQTGKDWTNQVALGDILLGYENDHGDVYSTGNPDTERLLHNGTFMVVRKIDQKVDAFHKLLGVTDQHGVEQSQLAAKLMGRTPDGVPLVSQPPKDGNSFSYSDDSQGKTCPLQSHVRRANPRTPPTWSRYGRKQAVPRIVRRGFSYGPRYADNRAEQRGLMFMAFNASLAEQYEVIQTWLNGGNSTGLYSRDRDPIVSHHQGGQVIKMPTDDGKCAEAHKVDDALTVLQWGMYLFVPSISALDWLATKDARAGKGPAAVGSRPSARAERGNELIARLRQRTNMSDGDALQVWKGFLNNYGIDNLSDPEAINNVQALWAAIREIHDGVLETPFGILVGTQDKAYRVFTDENAFSVREYWARMRNSIGENHLGLDRTLVRASSSRRRDLDAAYEARANTGGLWHDDFEWLNEAINRLLTEPKGYAFGSAVGNAVLRKIRSTSPTISLRGYAVALIFQLTDIWFGFEPSLTPKANRFTGPLTRPLAQYLFTTHPEPALRTQGELAGQELRKVAVATAKKLLKNPGALLQSGKPGMQGAKPVPGKEFLYAVLEHYNFDPKSRDEVGRAIAVAAQGFMAATAGSFIKVLEHWRLSGELLRLRDAFQRPPKTQKDLASDFVNKLLRESLYATMIESNPPRIMYRTAIKNTELGGVQVNTGDRVVVGLGSASREYAPNQVPHMLFGGERGKTIHACPGREVGIGVMLGGAVALLGQAGNMRSVASMVISIE